METIKQDVRVGHDVIEAATEVAVNNGMPQAIAEAANKLVDSQIVGVTYAGEVPIQPDPRPAEFKPFPTLP